MSDNNNDEDEYDLNFDEEYDPETPVEYEPVCFRGRWMIKVMPASYKPWLMSCGLDQTEAGVWERIRLLRLDDDGIDVQTGKPRKYQG